MKSENLKVKNEQPFCSNLFIALFSLFTIHCSLFTFNSNAEFIRVGIFTDVSSSRYVFIAGNCDYLLTGDHKSKYLIKKDESVTFQLNEGYVVCKYKEKVIGKYLRVKCAALEKDGFFRLKSLQPETQAIPFPDFLEVIPLKARLSIINVVDLEKYVSSVIEAEAGDNTNQEFLKVQAILCRTFALGNLTRHVTQGYQVCDNVHCQVFPAMSRFNNAIQAAVEQTRNMVLVDNKNRLITGAFHSNCGGQTADAKDAWTSMASCLKSVHDTFCIHSPHAVWQRTIDKKTWTAYLRKKIQDSRIKNQDKSADIPDSCFLILDSSSPDSLFTFMQPSRQYELHYQSATIPLKSIRYDFKLKSTWFNILPRGDSLLFQGFGFGHGVGLCQEGAMKMAEYGYKMKEIINFYFKGVLLENYDAIKFLKGKS